MRYLIVVPCALISLVMLGGASLATYQALTQLEFGEFIEFLTDDVWNITVFSVAWIGGIGFLGAAIALIAPAKKQAKN